MMVIIISVSSLKNKNTNLVEKNKENA
jgi:hypothetical protein